MSEATHICPECNGRGLVTTLDYELFCRNCDGTGWLDEHGEPIPLEKDECANSNSTTKSPESFRS